MQNKGAIKFFAIAFALVCGFQLSFTFFTRHVENKAKKYANNQTAVSLAKQLSTGDALKETFLYDSIAKSRERYYLDSMSNKVIYNILVRKYSYKDCKEREINLGLDLKGGMNVTMEISVVDIIKALADHSTNPTFVKTIDLANQKFKTSQKDYVTLFAESFKEVDPNAKLAAIFSTFELKDRITPKSTNEEVINVLREETEGAIDRTFNILRTRIDRFGVTQPNIQRLQTAGRILIELPGIKEPDRVRKLLQGTANLEFWETWEFSELTSYFTEANKRLAERIGPNGEIRELLADTTVTDTTAQKTDIAATDDKKQAEVTEKKDTTKSENLLDQIKDTSKAKQSEAGKEDFEEFAKKNPLYAYLTLNLTRNEQGQYYPGQGPLVGFSAIKDTARVNHLLKVSANVFPRNLKLYWTVKPAKDQEEILQLIALRVTSRDGSAPLTGDVIVDARQDFSQTGNVEITMNMNPEGARTWARLTSENVGKSVAIVLDQYVYSFPRVNEEIPNGRSSISGNFTVEEAKDLANILKAGKLPAPARIVQEDIVGPSLGKEAINAGMISFILAFILVLLYMGVYYNTAGWVANAALLINVFFLFGILASLGAVLTLPGIAGIVLTFGMDVDSNVVIYERIKEEIRAGKGIRLAVADGYKHAYSAIIDSKVTTILTGIILYIFGSGPIQGFATTLIIGLTGSLFTAIFITRLIFEWMLDKNYNIKLWHKFNEFWFTNINFDFIKVRKKLYLVSLTVILLGIGAIGIRGMVQGVDFTGGRSYVVRFDQNVQTNEVRASLSKVIGEEPEVKTFGPDNQVRVTTKYLINENDPASDSIVDQKLYEGLKGHFKDPISFDEFTTAKEGKLIGKLSSQKVGPVVAKDIKRSAFISVFIALLVIFAYIAIRFKKWQWGMGGVISLFHDAIISLSLYAWLHGIVPFTLEVDQTMIAAILTIIGFSINDTVIIFDRIREYRNLYPKRDLAANVNDAINHTLSRTINTSGTVLVVLLAILIFGGEIIRGMNFILFMGILVGTYSSVFNATPLAYDFIMWRQRVSEKKLAKLKEKK
ncbi:MAG: protein translocase subunit SecDF [Bacteroidales bacterium]